MQDDTMTPELNILPYSAKRRKIYTYWNGKAYVQADPMELAKKLFQVGQALSIDMKIAAFPNYPAAPSAHDSMVATIRELFDLVPLPEGGLSESESVDLLNHFLIYLGMMKKTYEAYSDLTGGNIGHLRMYLGRMPTYEEFYGLWLNKNRSQYRQAAMVALGAGIAFGSVDPGEDYFRAIAEGEDEAKFLRMQYLSSKNSRKN